MKRFSLAIIMFCLPLILITVIAIILPTTPRQQEVYGYAWGMKDSLLQATESPKMVFLGGSNLAFGLDSRRIHDSLNIHPINMGLEASVGLVYILESAFSAIDSGDIVVISPEYEHFRENHSYGSSTLIKAVFNVRRMNFKEEMAQKIFNIQKLNYEQYNSISKYLYSYVISKYTPSEYRFYNEQNQTCYTPKSFNEYGDNTCHWTDTITHSINLEPRFKSEINTDIIDYLDEYCKRVENKGAKVYLSYPAMYDKAFDTSIEFIEEIITLLNKKDIHILGNPYKYKMPLEYVYDLHYHPNKKGVDFRTTLLLNDLREVIQPNK